MKSEARKGVPPWRWVVAVLLVAIGPGWFWYPGFVVVRCFFDDTLRRGGISPLAVGLHETLTRRLPRLRGQPL